MNHPIQLDPVSFMAHVGPLDRCERSTGALSGVTLAVKDLFDVRGHRTGAGNPDWLATHDPSLDDAWAVAKLMAAGARLIGKTLTDEMAYSLIGDNYHYGMPVNPKATGRIPGGSSCGSASVVAQGLADLALGTDTGGSVRIPAGFCGVYGFRPTHGRVPVEGLVPLGPSFDTVGWFARDAALLQRAGQQLMPVPDTAAIPRRLIRLEEMFDAADPETRPVLDAAADRIARLFGAQGSAVIENGDFADWRNTYIHVQGYEAWRTHAAWITGDNPNFGPLTKARFDFAASISTEEASRWSRKRDELSRRVLEVIGLDAVLCLPTAPGAPIARKASSQDYDTFRGRILDYTIYAGVCGAPQVTIPAGMAGGGPVGISLIGAPGSDLSLLALANVLGELGVPSSIIPE